MNEVIFDIEDLIKALDEIINAEQTHDEVYYAVTYNRLALIQIRKDLRMALRLRDLLINETNSPKIDSDDSGGDPIVVE